VTEQALSSPPRRKEGFAPIQDYAVLSDMRSTALVCRDGSIDWWAAPVMDEPPLCCALLDPRAGGAVRLEPAEPYRMSRQYVPGTLVLETTYVTGSGSVTVSDSLNLGRVGLLPWAELARLVRCISGNVRMRWAFAPGHGLRGTEPFAWVHDGMGFAVLGDQHVAVVLENAGVPDAELRQLVGSFDLSDGEEALIALSATRGEPLFAPGPDAVREHIEMTKRRWSEWSNRIAYDGPFRDEVVRSALAIKALTLQPTGGIAAAATTSLPENVGGKRNFDYRFAWVRDGAFALDAMGRLGLDEELHAGTSWLLSAVAHEAPHISVFYTVQGQPVPPKMSDADAPGYLGSSPVHLGNKASAQTQLGGYGHVLDAVWRFYENGGTLDPSSASMLAGMVDQVCDRWQRPDAGLWELGDDEQYTSSKIGCWTALDRAVRLHEAGQLAAINVDRWRAERDAVQKWVRENCWSSSKQAFTFYAGTDDLDCAVLLAARTRFCSSDDSMLHSTVDAIRSELTAEGSLLFRYSGMRGKEGAFLACSFWLVEALVHVGRRQEAEELLTGLVRHANDVGLYSEEIDPSSHELLGNIPQALTHLAMIGAATALQDPGK
jgi:GH15 family glucan-1,4-alpha-glucosidase